MWQNTAYFSDSVYLLTNLQIKELAQTTLHPINHKNIRFEKSPTIILLSYKPFKQAPVHVFQGATRRTQFSLHPLWAKSLQGKAPHQQLINTNPGTSFCPLTPSECQACAVKLELCINIPGKTSDLLYAVWAICFSSALCKFALFLSIIKRAASPINFSLTVIASLPCTNYTLSRLQTFSKVFSIKIEINCPGGKQTIKSQSGLCAVF